MYFVVAAYEMVRRVCVSPNRFQYGFVVVIRVEGSGKLLNQDFRAPTLTTVVVGSPMRSEVTINSVYGYRFVQTLQRRTTKSQHSLLIECIL